MKIHVEPMEEYIVVKKLENGVVILWWILLHSRRRVWVGVCLIERNSCSSACSQRAATSVGRESPVGYSIVLCEYSKFRIESNSYFSIRFETSTIIQNFRILTVTNVLLI